MLGRAARLLGRWALPLAVAPLALLACSESDDVVFTADTVVVYRDGNDSSTTVVVVPPNPVVIERIWSPEATTAELLGVGALLTDPVTVDGRPADVLAFDVDADGFTLQVRILEAGAHEVCVRDRCDRVFLGGAADPVGDGG